jgi:CRISPR/Cas system CMR-associated protein Cmr5 small subunit
MCIKDRDKELQVAYHIINDLKKGNNQFEYSFPNYKKAANVAFYLLEPKLICKITYDNGTVDSVMKKDLNSNKWIFIERLD